MDNILFITTWFIFVIIIMIAVISLIVFLNTSKWIWLKTDSKSEMIEMIENFNSGIKKLLSMSGLDLVDKNWIKKVSIGFLILFMIISFSISKETENNFILHCSILIFFSYIPLFITAKFRLKSFFLP